MKNQNNLNWKDHQGIVYKLTKKYKSKNYYEDLVQEGMIALQQACVNWDKQTVSLSTYLFNNVKWAIFEELKKEIKYEENISYFDNFEELDNLKFIGVSDEFIQNYMKPISGLKNYYISENGKIINMNTIKEVKVNDQGFAYIKINGKTKTLNINKLMQDYYQTGLKNKK